MRDPEPLVVDKATFFGRCVDCDLIDDGDEYRPYVDLKIDTIPHRRHDHDYSESPAILRKTAAWLLQAAEWLETKQREFRAYAAGQD